MSVDALPATIGRYEILSLLGSGGSAAVYLGRDPIIERHVAVKLRRDKFDDPESMDRFTREVRAAGQLHHPNIVTIFDVGQHDARPFIAMEYVPGETLASLIQRQAPLTLEARLRLVEDACAGLGYAHGRGVLHLDVKPENLMVQASGVVKIVDFGISRMLGRATAKEQHVFGTPRYLSPERIQGEVVDHRSDVFSLGCVLYEVLAYRPAFVGTVTEIVSRILTGTFEPLDALVPDLPADAVRIVNKAMAPAARDRYADFDSLRRELGELRRRIDGTTDLAGLLDGRVASLPQWSTATTNVAGRNWFEMPTDHAARTGPARGTGANPTAARGETAGARGGRRSGTRWTLLAALVVIVAAAAAIGFWRSGAGIGSPADDTRAVDPDDATAAGAPPATDGTAVVAPDFDREIWRLVALGNQRGALDLLRGLDAAAIESKRPLFDDLVATARADITRARAGADQRLSRPSASPAYRAGVEAAARGDALLERQLMIDALTAFWEATDRFGAAASEATRAPAGGRVVGQTTAAAPVTEPPAPASPEPPRATAAASPPPARPAPIEPTEPAEPTRASPRLTAPPIPAAPSVAPTPTISASPRADRAEIDELLGRYQSAYVARDVNALRRLMPSLSTAQAEALSRTFANAVSYDVTLTTRSVTVSGDTAVVTGVVTHELVPRIGSRTRTSFEAEFVLVRADASWIIERVERRQP